MRQIERVLLIVNPASRRGSRHRQSVERAFRGTSVVVDVLATERPGHATELVRQAGTAHDAVFVLGGDGTVMDTVTALAGTGRPVGVLPGGTGNLVAGMLGVPKNPARAVHALLSGEWVMMDLARVTGGGRYFAFAAGIGIDAAMVTETSSIWKRRLGVLAYVWSASRAVLRRREFGFVADLDGRLFDARASLVMVVNSGSLFRGTFHIGPEISSNDGMLDLCVFSPNNLADVVSIVRRAWRKDFRPHRRMHFMKARRIRLDSQPPRVVQADGDEIGVTPIEIQVVPGAATFLVPRG